MDEPGVLPALKGHKKAVPWGAALGKRLAEWSKHPAANANMAILDSRKDSQSQIADLLDPLLSKMTHAALKTIFENELSYNLASIRKLSKSQEAHSSYRLAISQLKKCWEQFSPHLPAGYVASKLVQTGESLLEIDGFHNMADLVCFMPYLEKEMCVYNDRGPAERRDSPDPETICKYINLSAADPSLHSPRVRGKVVRFFEEMLGIIRRCAKERGTEWLVYKGINYLLAISGALLSTGFDWPELVDTLKAAFAKLEETSKLKRLKTIPLLVEICTVVHTFNVKFTPNYVGDSYIIQCARSVEKFAVHERAIMGTSGEFDSASLAIFDSACTKLNLLLFGCQLSLLAIGKKPSLMPVDVSLLEMTGSATEDFAESLKENETGKPSDEASVTSSLGDPDAGMGHELREIIQRRRSSVYSVPVKPGTSLSTSANDCFEGSRSRSKGRSGCAGAKTDDSDGEAVTRKKSSDTSRALRRISLSSARRQTKLDTMKSFSLLTAAIYEDVDTSTVLEGRDSQAEAAEDVQLGQDADTVVGVEESDGKKQTKKEREAAKKPPKTYNVYESEDHKLKRLLLYDVVRMLRSFNSDGDKLHALMDGIDAIIPSSRDKCDMQFERLADDHDKRNVLILLLLDVAFELACSLPDALLEKGSAINSLTADLEAGRPTNVSNHPIGLQPSIFETSSLMSDSRLARFEHVDLLRDLVTPSDAEKYRALSPDNIIVVIARSVHVILSQFPIEDILFSVKVSAKTLYGGSYRASKSTLC
ncbi:hypothetical protein HK101_002057 [Irineochytrium annulatum]|nr:hypothetical protein HK101_002057 [Irineochytrium annulatum]